MNWPRLVRHQIGAISATALDFLVMIVCVESGLLAPVAATAVGSASGGITNFLLGRHWIFAPVEASVTAPVVGQALRYAMVSAACLALNAMGEHVVYGVIGAPYVIARVLVAALVSLAWSYPMQRAYVFHAT